MFLFKSSVKVKSDHFYIFQINLQLAELMSPKQNVTVITKEIPISQILIKHGIKTYSTSGEFLENPMAYAGCFTEEFIVNSTFIFVFSPATV